MSVGVGSGLARLWRLSMGNGSERVVRRIKGVRRVRAGRFCPGNRIICGCGTDVDAGAANPDSVDRGVVGADRLRSDAAIVFPDSKTLGLGLDVACRLIAVAAAADLVRYRLGRIGLGPFLFAAGLLTLNLHWFPLTSHIPSEAYLLSEVLFGSSLLLVALDDSWLRNRRLALLNDLTVPIAAAKIMLR